MSVSLSDVLPAYGAAWRETDPEKRLELLNLAWSDDGVYRDPSAEAVGRTALSDHIGVVQSQQTGARIELTSGASHHHGHIYFTWRMLNAEGAVAINGIDFGTLDGDGRLSQIVGFFGPPPPA